MPLKGIAEPVELALCPQPHERSVDPVCGMAVDTSAVVGTTDRFVRRLRTERGSPW